ncbi:MAG: hypothetical protein ACLP50_31370 [Solirubrobacteraceae bacterium]
MAIDRFDDREPAHDILAAEEFGVPAPDPALHHHRPVILPADPTGIAEPHDVLAAEEFAMPAPTARAPVSQPPRPRLGPAALALAAAGGLGLLVTRRLRKRRS